MATAGTAGATCPTRDGGGGILENWESGKLRERGRGLTGGGAGGPRGERAVIRGSGKLEFWGTGKLGNWEAGKLGSWEAGKLGNWEAGKLGGWEAGRLGGWEAGKLGSWGTEGATGQLPGRRGNYRRRSYGGGTAGDNAGTQRSGCDREALGKQLRFMFLFNHHSLRMEQIKLSRTGQ